MVATVAHDLRAPLSALETAAEMLASDFDRLDEGERRELIATIHRRAVWMRGFLENLLTDAAMQEGGLRVLPRLVDLRESVDEVCAYIAPLLARKSQALVVTSDAAPHVVAADPHRISQVLMNLLSNANKYAGHGTEIRVTITVGPSAVRVTVADEGPGLPRAALGRVFDAYERGGRRDGGGVGIGLWIVRSVVQAHGGNVGVENGELSGARFWFELPLMASDRSGEGDPAETIAKLRMVG